MQDADFHNAWGPSESACSSSLAALCAMFDCPAGKQVNPAAKTSCLNEVNTSTCDAFNSEQYLTACGQVCTGAPATGSGGGNGGGLGGNNGGLGGNNGGLGGAGGGTAIADAITFCTMSTNLICDRAFQCIPVASRTTDFTSNYGATVAACKAMTATTCVDPATNCPNYSPAAGGSCVAALGSAACADLVLFGGIFPPVSCFNACP